ncbi:hypothetical protein PFISCL1PPCAC_27765, partial [Pristionchus fissidentatus]
SSAASSFSQKSKGSNVGVLGWFANTLRKAIPSSDQMILPDDSKKTIYYDERLGRYVGEGVEEETAPPPPPLMRGVGEGTSGGGGLMAARTNGGSRYFNPLNNVSSTSSVGPSA